MKNIIFISPPAGGKGTQSDLLVKKYNYKHISVGNLLREEVESGSEDGKIIDAELLKGNFVPDEMATKILKKALINNEGPFIFDGYPRTLKQLDDFEEILKELNMNNIVAVYLNLSEEEAIKRATGRMICPTCSRTYHKYYREVKPKVDNLCDKCITTLVVRNDDKLETYQERYKNYKEKTAPLINKFKEKGILFTINDPVHPDETFKQIEKVIKWLRQKKK